MGVLISVIFEWLRDHPWGWFLVLGTGIGGFVLWLRQPVTWRNAEGPLIDDGRRFGRGLRAVGDPLVGVLLLAEKFLENRLDSHARRKR